MADSQQSQTKIVVPGSQSMVSLLGSRDELLGVLERGLTADIHVRGNEITLTGDADAVELARSAIVALISLQNRGEPLTVDDVERTIAMVKAPGEQRPADVLALNILSNRSRTIRPKTTNQKRYVDAIDEHTIVFGIGPAGTGKTYLAMAKAVQYLQAKRVNRIILTRPAVEAGERLGFLPGTLFEKIDPYLRPLYDALHDMVDGDSIPRLMASGVIEVAPLAYMRGRAQPVDTPVLTPEGWRPIGSLQVGDLVIGSDGRPTHVLGVYPQGMKDLYRVTTQDGASTLCCAEHLWPVKTREDTRRGRDWRILETSEIAEGVRSAHDRLYELPLTDPVQFPAREVPMDPYALGLILGDGCSTLETTPSLSSHARQADGHGGGVIVTNPVTAVVRQLGLGGARSTTTFVPEDYLLNTPDVRLAVLQGLLDTDGGPVRQRGRTCRIQYTTCSDRLRDDVIFLVRSLGGVAHARTRKALGRKPGGTAERQVFHRSDAHIIDIRLPHGVEPFRLTHKREAYEADGSGRPMRFIDSVEPAGEAECVCISVAALDSLYVTEDFLVTHNTLNDAFIILDEAQNTSPEQMKMFLTRLGFGSKIVVTGDVTQVDLPTGTTSGLRIVRDILDGVDDVHFSLLTSVDVVRHRLVGDIVDAYTRYDEEQNALPSSGQQVRRGPSGRR